MAQRQADIRALEQSNGSNRFEYENPTSQQTQERLQLRAQLELKAQSLKQGQQMKLLATCEEGLRRILAVLEDYSVAFEAVGGMREQVRVAVDCLDLV
jgi:phosphoserine aminotransferase